MTRVSGTVYLRDILDKNTTYESLHIGHIRFDEQLFRHLGALTNVVSSLLKTKTCETQSGLSSSSMFLGQINREFVQYLTMITTKRSEETTVTVHHDESESIAVLQKNSEIFRVKLVVTQVQGRVDRFVRLKVYRYFSFLSLVRDYSTAVPVCCY